MATHVSKPFVKFENCSAYFDLISKDRLYHLKNSLEDMAGQTLWDTGPKTTAKQIIALLRKRFGHANQAERFRAELKSRRRRKGESLKDLYQDIARLKALAYPGPTSKASDIIACDAFLDALNDHALIVRILEKGVRNVEQAFDWATRLEAYDKRVIPEQLAERDEEMGRARAKQVRSAQSQPPKSNKTEFSMDDWSKYLTSTLQSNNEVLCNALQQAIQGMSLETAAAATPASASAASLAPYTSAPSGFGPQRMTTSANSGQGYGQQTMFRNRWRCRATV
jgi:hypothetical protein